MGYAPAGCENRRTACPNPLHSTSSEKVALGPRAVKRWIFNPSKRYVALVFAAPLGHAHKLMYRYKKAFAHTAQRWSRENTRGTEFDINGNVKTPQSIRRRQKDVTIRVGGNLKLNRVAGGLARCNCSNS